MKKFISSNKTVDIRENLLRSFQKDLVEIVEDAFGNYAVQHAIDIYGADVCSNIINQIVNNILSLSNQKFSSNVVEKCIIVTGRVSKSLIFNIPQLGNFQSNRRRNVPQH